MQGHSERCVWGCILVQASGRSWLLRTVLRPRWDLEVPIRSSPVLCRGTAWGCCPAAEGCALAALCAQGASWHDCTYVCGRGQCSRYVQGSRGCRGRVCAEMEGQLLFLLPWRPRDGPSAASATPMATALMGAVGTEAQVSQPH